MMKDSKKRILVTGGAGMIGTTLCSRLLAEGSEVFCLDNLQTGSKWNIRDMLNNELFHFLEKDITNPLDLDVDEIYHLACPASPKHYQEDPVRTARTNFQGALTVLELARRKQAKVLFTSTSEVYGEPLQHPQKEEYRGNVNPIGIRACYDEGKRIAETLFFDYHRKYGVDIRVARIFNTYGPYLDPRDGRVISNFIISALNHDNLVIYGDGNQTRSFCYVDDTVEALLRFMRKDKICGPVNIGNPHEITIRELAETIIRLTQCGTEIRHIAKPEDDPTRRCPDISLAEKELDWHPAVSLDEGLLKTIQYFRMRLAEDQMPQLPHYDTGLLMGVFDLFHIGHRGRELIVYNTGAFRKIRGILLFGMLIERHEFGAVYLQIRRKGGIGYHAYHAFLLPKLKKLIHDHHIFRFDMKGIFRRPEERGRDHPAPA